MSRPRRDQPAKFKKVDASPVWSAKGRCPACGKLIYESKKAARAAARYKHPDEHMSVYRCRSESARCPSPAPWHIGHLTDAIKDGSLTRMQLYGGVSLRTNNPTGGGGISDATEYLRNCASRARARQQEQRQGDSARNGGL